MTSFAKIRDVADLYHAGQRLGKPTLFIRDIGGAPKVPVEANIENALTNVSLGGFWYTDMRGILEMARLESDEPEKNPNYSVIRDAFARMTTMRFELGQEFPQKDTPEIVLSDKRGAAFVF